MNPKQSQFLVRGDVPAEGPPRALVGYGAHPPRLEWPNRARLAIQVVVNYEEGSEKTYAMGDRENDFMYEPPFRIEDRRDLAIESMYEYGARAGIWRLFRVLDEAGVPATLFAAAVALERNPEVAEKARVRGDEVAGHGFRWSNHYEMTPDEERAAIAAAVSSIEKTVGKRPVGWFCREMSTNTRELLVEDGGFVYDSDAFNDDLPYWTRTNGKDHLVVPYSLVLNDGRYLLAQGFSSPEDFFLLGKATIDQLRDDGDDIPRMMSIGMHARIGGYPGRANALARLLEYAQQFEDVWFARRIDIATTFITQVPPPPRGEGKP